jgi:hypothetical protein
MFLTAFSKVCYAHITPVLHEKECTGRGSGRDFFELFSDSKWKTVEWRAYC